MIPVWPTSSATVSPPPPQIRSVMSCEPDTTPPPGSAARHRTVSVCPLHVDSHTQPVLLMIHFLIVVSPLPETTSPPSSGHTHRTGPSWPLIVAMQLPFRHRRIVLSSDAERMSPSLVTVTPVTWYSWPSSTSVCAPVRASNTRTVLSLEPVTTCGSFSDPPKYPGFTLLLKRHTGTTKSVWPVSVDTGEKPAPPAPPDMDTVAVMSREDTASSTRSPGRPPDPPLPSSTSMRTPAPSGTAIAARPRTSEVCSSSSCSLSTYSSPSIEREREGGSARSPTTPSPRANFTPHRRSS